MNSHNPSITMEGIPLRSLFGRAARGGLRFWTVAVIAGFLLGLLAWPIPFVESIYIMAVWAPLVVFAPIISAAGDSLFWEHWGWVLGALAWLPLIVAFRFVHLVATHSRDLKGVNS